MKTSTKFIIGVIAAVGLLGLYPIYMFKANFTGEPLPANNIKGNGELKKGTLSLDNFEEIEIISNFDVVLKQGDFKVETEIDSNLEEFLDIGVNENRLQLKMKKGASFRNSNTPKVWVTMPMIRRAILFSSGELESEGTFSGEHMEVQILGSGEMSLNVECQTLKASITGSGEIELNGKSDFLEISLPGSGRIEAEDFLTQNTNIRISGSGEASVNASEHLDISISGSGNVRYSGNPTSVNKQISGSGDVSES